MALRQVKDTPTNNFATLNSLVPGNGNIAFDDGNLNLYSTDGNAYGYSWWPSILLPTKTSQIFYFEITGKNISTTNANLNVGLVPTSEVGTTSTVLSGSNVFYGENFWGRFNSDDVTAFLFDFINFKVTLFSGNAEIAESSASRSFDSSISNHDYAALCFQTGGGGQTNFVLNFGQNPDFSGQKTDSAGPYTDANGQGQFYYQPPAGALALCSRNIQSVEQDGSYVQNYVSAKGNFRAVTYTGNGGLNKISCGFQPDLVWVKQRHGTTAPVLADSIRGPGRFFNTDGASDEHNAADSWNTNEDSPNIETVLTNFTNNGFNVGGATNWNVNNGDYVAWCWKAAGAPADGGSSVDGSARIVNEDGTQADTTCDALASEAGAGIAPQKVTANRQAGFSIVMTPDIPVQAQIYTLPHGLNKAPELSIFKNADFNDSFYVRSKFTSSLLAVNQTWGTTTYQNYWEGGAFTYPLDSNIFSVRGSAFMGAASQRLISYHFHSVPGYSKIGYVDSLSDDPFVYLGFRPSWIMFKRLNDTSNWQIFDSSRDPYNVCDKVIRADENKVESSHPALNMLSNGFKTISYTGIAGGWIYMAFAEQPGAFSNAR